MNIKIANSIMMFVTNKWDFPVDTLMSLSVHVGGDRTTDDNINRLITFEISKLYSITHQNRIEKCTVYSFHARTDIQMKALSLSLSQTFSLSITPPFECMQICDYSLI